MTSLKERLEWIGGLAVIASLLLVAFEIQQNTDAVSAQAVYAVNSTGIEILMMQTSNPDVAHIVRIGHTNPDELDADQWFRYRKYVHSLLNLYESSWSFYERGFVDQQFIAQIQLEFCDLESQPGFSRAIASLGGWQGSPFLSMARGWCAD